VRNTFIAAVCGLLLSGCGGGNSTPSPTPTPTPPATNHNPTITSSSVTPEGFGISQITSFATQAVATDSDADGLTYEWDFGDGTTLTGAGVAHVYPGDGPMTVTLTVKDGKGGSTTATNALVVGGMTGRWLVEIPSFVRLQLDLQQNGTVVTGTFVQLEDGPTTPKGTSGKTDPAEPGKIDGAGNVEIRLKVGRFLDFYIRGTMDSTGRTIKGGLFGSGFGGSEFTATKE